VIVLDQCQNLLLRAVRGLEGFGAFTQLVGRSCPNVVWVCAFSRYAWEHAASATGAQGVFDVLPLGPWDERALEAMLRRRLEQAGWRAVVEGTDEGTGPGPPGQAQALPREAAGTVRMLLDRTDGIPRVAVNVWGRSLEPLADRVVKVRLAAMPSADALEPIGEEHRFVLAALVIHENLTAPEAGRAVHRSSRSCEIVLEALCALGVVERQGHRYRVTSFWHRSAVRYLRRKHLLHS
jgi:hypothetical protein